MLSPRAQTDGKYIRLRFLGKGMYGCVAEYLSPRGPVAVKRLNNSAYDIYFTREISVLKGMRECEDVLQMHELIEMDNGSLSAIGLVLELGTCDLFAFYRNAMPMTIQKNFCELYRCLRHAVAYLHRAGFVHRDVKPDNVLVLQKEKEISFRLADFGHARALLHDRDSHLWLLCAAMPYRAPEISLAVYETVAEYNAIQSNCSTEANKKIKGSESIVKSASNAAVLQLAEEMNMTPGEMARASDVWALGLTLVEYLSGKMLYPATKNSKLLKYQHRSFFIRIREQHLFFDEQLRHASVDSLILAKRGAVFYRQLPEHMLHAVRRMMAVEPTRRLRLGRPDQLHKTQGADRCSTRTLLPPALETQLWKVCKVLQKGEWPLAMVFDDVLRRCLRNKSVDSATVSGWWPVTLYVAAQTVYDHDFEQCLEALLMRLSTHARIWELRASQLPVLTALDFELCSQNARNTIALLAGTSSAVSHTELVQQWLIPAQSE